MKPTLLAAGAVAAAVAVFACGMVSGRDVVHVLGRRGTRCWRSSG